MAVDKQKRAEWLKEYRKTPKYKNYMKKYMRERRAKTTILEDEPSIYKDVEYVDDHVDLDDYLVEDRQELEARSDFIEQGRFQPTIVDVTDLTNGGMRVTYEFTPNEVLVADHYLANNDSYLDMMALANEKIKSKMISLCRDLLKTSAEIETLTSYAYQKSTLEVKQEQDTKNRNEYMRKYRDSDKHRKYIRQYRREQRASAKKKEQEQ